MVRFGHTKWLSPKTKKKEEQRSMNLDAEHQASKQHYHYQQTAQQQHQQQHQQQDKQYNSLLDPHLELYFRRPAVRRQLLANNIINKDSKIVEEMQSTAYKQAVTLAEKRRAYETIRLNQAKQREHRKSILDRVDALLLLDRHEPDHQSSILNESRQGDTPSPAPRSSPETLTTLESAKSPPAERQSTMFRHQSAPNLVTSCERSSRPKSSYGRRFTVSNRDCTSTSGNTNRTAGRRPQPSSSSISVDNHKSSLRASNRQSTKVMSRNMSKSLHNLWRTPSTSSSLSLHRLIVPKTATSGNMGAQMTMKYQSRLKVTSLRRVTIAQQRMVGGTTVNIFDRHLRPGDEFTFSLREHSLGAFALVFMLDQIRDARLNACCEYKHRSGARFGHFLLVSISGGRPCLLCQEKIHSRSIRFNLESIDRSEKALNTVSIVSPSLESCSSDVKNATVLLTAASPGVTSDFEVNVNDIQRQINANQEEEYRHDSASNDSISINKQFGDVRLDSGGRGSKHQNGDRHYDTETTAGVLAANESTVPKPNHQQQNDDNRLLHNSAAKVVNMRTTITESRFEQQHKGMLHNVDGNGVMSSATSTDDTSHRAHPVDNRSQQAVHKSSPVLANIDNAKVQLNDSIDDGGDAQLHRHSSSLSSDSANDDHESNANSFENESLPSLMLEMSSSSSEPSK